MAVLLTIIWASSIDAAQKLTLILDWFPNVDHLPIYVGRHQGFFAAEGLEIEIISPSATADALKLAASGTVELAVSYEPRPSSPPPVGSMSLSSAGSSNIR